MNKKIKIIELFQKSANNEELPKKIYFDGDVFELDTEGVYKSNGTLLVDCLNYDLSNLNDYIKVLEDNTEDNTEEIEELDEEWTYIEGQVEKTWSKSELELVNKINELVKAVNKLRKEKENESNNM